MLLSKLEEFLRPTPMYLSHHLWTGVASGVWWPTAPCNYDSEVKNAEVVVDVTCHEPLIVIRLSDVSTDDVALVRSMALKASLLDVQRICYQVNLLLEEK